MPSASEFLDGVDVPTKGTAADYLDGKLDSAPASPVQHTASSGPSAFPLPSSEGNQMRDLSPFGDLGAHARPTPVDWPQKLKDVAYTGVDITSGGPWAMRSRVDLADDTDERLRAVEKSGYKSRIGPDSQQLEYFNPDSQRWTTVHQMNPLQFQTPSAVQMGTGAASLAAGVVAPESILGQVAGQAVAGSASEIGKKIVAGSMGIKTSTSLKSDALDVAKEGFKQGAWTAGGALAMTAPGALASFAKYGTTLSPSSMGIGFYKEFWPDIKAGMDEGQRTLDEFQTLVGAGGDVPKLDSAELAGGAGAPIHRSLDQARQTVNVLGIRNTLRDQRNLSALQKAMDQVTQTVQGPGPVNPYAGGQDIVEWVAKQKASAQAQTAMSAEQARDKASAAVQGLPTQSLPDSNQRITKLVQDMEGQEKSDMDAKWTAWKVLAGKPEAQAGASGPEWLDAPREPTLGYSVSSQAEDRITNLLKEAKDAWPVDSQRAAAKISAIPDGLLKKSKPQVSGPQEPVSAADRELLDSLGIPEVADKDVTPGKGVIIGGTRYSVDTSPKDAYEISEAIKGLKAGTRQDMARSKGWLPPESQDTLRVAQTLDQDLMLHLSGPHPEAMEALQDANQATRSYAQRFRTGLLGNVNTKADGFNKYEISTFVNNALLNGAKNPTAMRELSSIADGSPELKDSINNSILAYYKTHFTEDGVPTPALHDSFVKQFGPAIDEFFDKEGQARIKTLRDLGTAVANNSKQVAQFDKLWKNSPYADLPVNSYQIARAGFSNTDAVRGIGSWLRKNNPDLLTALQRDTAIQLKSRVIQNGSLNAAALNKVLDPVKGHNFQDIMPPEYTAGLKTIRDTARLMSMSPSITAPAEENLLKTTMRTIVGQFGREGRILTWVNKFRSKNAARLIDSVMGDPDKMREFMLHHAGSDTSLAAKSGWLTSVGAQAMAPDYSGTPPSSSSSDSTR